ncbi:hypothetical protein [Corallococcus sp. AB038B]|uniref:hypothetical protein n=1 Tax=Corallococcus sp. AB038B TaxID=2316718 RepID=UPI000EC9E2A5|nr:hypothetical protein [Corallococcus sp. AB038B]RKI05071.1 hypothetical protein D7Y04_09405 [Corallococcus sp. AB038B]
MALLAEYALTPDVFDVAAHSSEEVCGLHLQALKDVLLHEGLVRNLRAGEWAKAFDDSSRPWHQRGKELLKKLQTQQRIVLADAAAATAPQTDAQWCAEALASHSARPLAGVIATDATAAPHARNAIVSSVSKLSSAPWWASRSPSLRLGRTLVDYEASLAPVLRHANSLIFVDPFIDPTDRHQYSDLMKILTSLRVRTVKPLVEIHRAAWYGGGNDKRPKVNDVVAALTPEISAAAKTAGLSVDVFLWDDIHDRYLITDLIGISLPYGFGTTRAPNVQTTWTRLGRDDRDAVQRDFDPARRSPRHRFTVKGT